MKGKIYKVQDSLGVVKYVGQTLQELQARINQHKNSDSILGRKLKAGIFFTFTVEREVPILELDAWEAFYIGKYNTLAPNGYNLQLPFSSARMTEAMKSKIRKTKSYGKIYTIDKLGTILTFDSGRHAALSLNINIAHVYECINGKRYAAGNRTFWREGQPAKSVSDIRTRPSHAVIVTDMNTGEQWSFSSVYSCGKVLKMDQATINRGLKSKKEIKYRNYKIRRNNDNNSS